MDESNEKQPEREVLNIIVLGASFAGLAVAHGYLTKIIEELGKTRSAPRYKLTLIGPSTCLYWNIGAPRAIVNDKELPLNDVFVPFLPLFEDYQRTRFEFVQGIATSVDFHARTVIVDEYDERKLQRLSHATSVYEKKKPEVLTQRIMRFHALVCATGTSAESELLSLHGPHERTQSEIRAFHQRLAVADGIVVAGGGCSGVEVAGQIATWLNRGKKAAPNKPPYDRSGIEVKGIWRVFACSAKKFSAAGKEGEETANKPSNTRKTIVLISGHDRLLPKLRPEFGAQAEAKLKKLGIHIIHNHKVRSMKKEGSGRTQLTLDKDIDIFCDVYVPATGVYPNTSFMPAEMKTATGYIDADPKSLRVPGVDRVYAVGDCASHSKNSIQDVYDSLPVLLQNLKNDLIAWEYQTEHPRGGPGGEMKLEQLEDYEYVQNQTDSQLMPISKYGGVGILFGYKLPSIMVWLMKGRDYRKGRAKLAAGAGKDPYAVV